MTCMCCYVEEEVEEEPVDRVRDAFKVMDINSDGSVTFNEFKKVKINLKTNDRTLIGDS